MKKTSVYLIAVFPLALVTAFGQGAASHLGRTGSGTTGPAQNPTVRISVDSAGGQADGYSSGGSPSADARVIAFGSADDHLVPGDSNAAFDVFVHDRISGAVTIVSVDSNGVPGNGESYCGDHCISADGRFVLFGSAASNLVGGDTNGFGDVFVHDLSTGTTTRVNLDSQGGQAAGNCWPDYISADGRVVAFTSEVDGLVSGDANGVEDVFVHDTRTGITERVSVSSAGIGGNAISQSPSLSTDGRYVVFGSWAANLVASDANAAVDVYLRDRQAGLTTLVSVASAGQQGNSASYSPCITPDGRYVAFASYADNLVPGDVNGESDIFVKDLTTGAVALASVSTSEVQGNGGSTSPSLSSDARFVAFHSIADNFTPGDTNLCADGFVRDLLTGKTWLVTTPGFQRIGNDFSGNPIVSADGRYVAFDSFASNLVPGDTNSMPDVFLRRNRP